MEAFLKRIYYDPKNPASFTGVAALRKAAIEAGYAGASWGKIRKWLSEQETYTLFKTARKKFKQNTVPAVGIDYQFEIDLADMSRYADENKGYKYILAVMDTFSRYGWNRAVKSKSTQEVSDAMASILKEGRKSTLVRSDKGGEFKSRKMSKVLDDEGIKQIFAQNSQKASSIERYIKTIKSLIVKDMYQRQNRDWISRLPDITEGYNARVHSATGQAPKDINKTNEDRSRLVQYLKKRDRLQGKAVASSTLEASKKSKEEQNTKKEILADKKSTPSKRPAAAAAAAAASGAGGAGGARKRKTVSKTKFKFKKGDIVRISYLKDKFTRAYDENFSHELFTVVLGFYRDDIPVYKIKDWSGEAIEGTFYQPELTLASEPENGEYKIDEIIKSKTVGKKKQYLVSYVGWPKKYNSWVSERDVRGIKKA